MNTQEQEYTDLDDDDDFGRSSFEYTEHVLTVTQQRRKTVKTWNIHILAEIVHGGVLGQTPNQRSHVTIDGKQIGEHATRSLNRIYTTIVKNYNSELRAYNLELEKDGYASRNNYPHLRDHRSIQHLRDKILRILIHRAKKTKITRRKNKNR